MLLDLVTVKYDQKNKKNIDELHFIKTFMYQKMLSRRENIH